MSDNRIPTSKVEISMTELPTLDEIMAYGLGLTEALAFWKRLAEAPPEIRSGWKEYLEDRKSLKREAMN